MERIKVMIVEDNERIRRILREYFDHQDRTQVVACASNGQEALDLLVTAHPDVILLDMVMPQMDGLGFLEHYTQMGLDWQPIIVVLSALGRDDFIAQAIEMGVRYYMIKPFDNQVVYQRVIELYDGAAGISSPSMSFPRLQPLPSIQPFSEGRHMDERIASMFLSIGIPAHIKGYQYLREAVKLVLENNDMINRITKELYPGVARHFGTTSSKVERAIRHAIEVAWSRGRVDNINQIFGYNVCSIQVKPTNGEFIALIADKLAMERTA